MPWRILLLVLSLGAGLLAGCGTATPGNAGSSKSSPQIAGQPAAEIDNSPAAVERRTEAHAHYAAAVVFDIQEKADEAAKEFLEAGLADLSNEDLILEICNRLLYFRETDKAVELLSKAAAQPAASGIIHAQLGRAYMLAGKKDLAIEANRTAIKKMPRSAVGYRHLAQIHLQSGQTEEGMKVLDEAAKLPDADAGFLLELAEFYFVFSRGASVEAAKPRMLEILDRVHKLKPANPIHQQKLADYLAVLGEVDRAIPLYTTLLERYPHLPGLREKLYRIYAGKPDKTRALELLEEMVRENPTDAQTYYRLGLLASESKAPEKAVEYFSKTILLKEDFEQGYYDLAGAQVGLNKPREALDTLEKARKQFKKPSFVNEFFSAVASTRLKEYTNAIKHYVAAEVIARASNTNLLTHTFYFQIAATYERTQRFEDAEFYFRKSLDLSPDFSESLNYLGYMWAERGEKLSEALGMIEKAVKLEPKNAAFLDSLGWVLYKLDKPKEALPHLLKAIEQSEEPDATLYDHLGDVYLALSKPEKAREAWAKALTIEPNDHKDAIRKKLGADGAPLQH